MKNGRDSLALVGALGCAVAVALAAGACGEGGPVTAPDGPGAGGEPSPASGSVEATLSFGPHQDGEQRVVVRIRGEELAVGAYQGRLRFDASAVSLARVVKGRGGDGSGVFRVLNDREAEAGELRFAAYAVEGFADPVALELAFESSRPLRASDLELRLEVVGTVEGRPVPAERTSVREELR